MDGRLSVIADSQPYPKQFVDIAKRVAAQWTLLASCLSPELFGPLTGNIAVIQQQERDPFMQAHRMLGQWNDHYASRATRRKLIQSMCEASLQAQAQAAFDKELVDFVMDSQPHETGVLGASPLDLPLPNESMPREPEADAPGREPDGFLENDKIGALIVTAVAVERKAVLKVLDQAGCKTFLSHPIKDSKGKQLLACMTTSWKVNETSRPIKVAVTKQTDTGAGGAADIGTAVKTAVDCNEMKNNGFLAMAGVCAGHKDKTKLGDVMVPWKLSSESGGKDTPRGHQPAAEHAEIKQQVKLAVEQTEMILELETSGISKYIPKTMRGTPSPMFLLDATLCQLNDSFVDADTVHEALIERYKWPEQVITAEVIEEALGKIVDQKYAEKYAEKDEWKFKISPNGAQRKKSKRFPRKDDSNLRIWHDPVVQGATVRTAMDTSDWTDQGSRVGQRKAVGYEMEGYTFLSQAQKWCNDMNQLFVKVVSDYATEEYKMDYYQEYAACVAAAFVLRILEDTPSLAGRQA